MELGVVVTIENPRFADVVFRRAREAGFDHGQVNFVWSPLTASIIRHVAAAAETHAFRVVAVGCLANLLRLADKAVHSEDEADLLALGRNIDAFGDCRKLVLWSGTYARKWTEPSLLNLGEDAYFAMVFELQRLLGQFTEPALTVALQPCYAHILHDIATTLRLPDDFAADRVTLNLDPAYMIAPTLYSKHPEIVGRIIAALAPMASLVTLSDLIIRESSLTHPLPGRGTLDFRNILEAIETNAAADIPHLLHPHSAAVMEDLVAARQYVLDCAGR
ncbi:MAG: hypothetical protein P4L33_22670 [Capsulimonadaceae bacterium]|nr:hypothetical protein [Capsulimonadaceae bacterium]